jgi:hypothetical protein
VFFSTEYKKYADVLDGMLNSGHKMASVAKIIPRPESIKAIEP